MSQAFVMCQELHNYREAMEMLSVKDDSDFGKAVEEATLAQVTITEMVWLSIITNKNLTVSAKKDRCKRAA